MENTVKVKPLDLNTIEFPKWDEYDQRIYVVNESYYILQQMRAVARHHDIVDQNLHPYFAMLEAIVNNEDVLEGELREYINLRRQLKSKGERIENRVMLLQKLYESLSLLSDGKTVDEVYEAIKKNIPEEKIKRIESRFVKPPSE